MNSLPAAEAEAALFRCCGSSRWVSSMLARRPFATREALLAAADEIWAGLGRADFLEAFSHHPAIGADIAELRKRFAATSAWSSEEQAGAAEADEATLAALRAGNLSYAARFGYIFIVCASGKSAREMLALLEQRLQNAPQIELGVAAAEQAKITKLRLEKLA
ncbi:MAG TPA: 2-oxo-4-hydroxy-4-carboxy-5-ureidoimidazoline decarboxylase [Polyangiaceae bacterium]|nr:2-oxo-4-hydroxy-4-carboxy-5-ureidoimidazoline decarboxylase [Polyangiaceae bacterium]